MDKSFNVLSLFDGMSCGQIALERAGITVDNYFASEIDIYAMKITQKNYPGTKQIGDINKINGLDLPKIDLLMGGSPCQGFSSSGQLLNFEDPRSKLFFEYVRILIEAKPRYFLLENVIMKKEWEDIITNILGVEPIRINSKLVSAQSRPRIYWTNIPNVVQPVDKGILLKDIVETEVDKKYYISNEALERTKRSKFGRRRDTLEDEKTGTVIAQYYKNPTDGIYLNDGKGIRKYTPLECERLQTIPENYTEGVSNSQRYKMVGNGWTVDVITHILRNLPE